MYSLVENVRLGDINWVKKQLASGCNVNQINHDGKTGLHIAVEFYKCNNYPSEIMKLLLNAGADVNIRSNNEGHTPLYYAIHNSNFEAVKSLVERINCYKELERHAEIYANPRCSNLEKAEEIYNFIYEKISEIKKNNYLKHR